MVVKLGGSLFGTPRLPELFQLLASAPHGVVVVPGGGRFADAVRTEQVRLGYSDLAAHRMALLAMDQMALALPSIAPQLVPFNEIDAVRPILEHGRLPVWMPFAMADAEPSLPTDWTLTSDGLAAWLAGTIGAARVVLVKSCAIEPSHSAADLARAGIVDPTFPFFVERFQLPWSVVALGDEQRLTDAISGTDGNG